MRSTRLVGVAGAVAAAALLVGIAAIPELEPAIAAPDGESCIECHEREGIAVAQIMEYKKSRHYREGMDCSECHAADAEDADAFEHYGSTIAIIVSPKDCGECHPKEVEEFSGSHHAQGGRILGSLDNILGEVVEGIPAANNGCKQCHGSIVRVMEDGKLDPATWPNTGIGRVNPDGSEGSCTACHSRHLFSVAVARRPESCGKCHLGPDHPQKEIYDESKHGIAFYRAQDEMNLDSPEWVLGKDYSAAPTCATCHMSATRKLPVSHDIGERISWTLRPAISKKLDNWEARRGEMKQVCGECHSPAYVDAFYVQFDSGIELYNEKFAEPATAIIDKLNQAGKLTPTPFDEEIEWTYFFLWHHEGRRARHGISMMGPDYTQWHGFYEVAHRFYIELLPEAEHLLPGVTAEFLDNEHHRWFTEGINEEDRKKIEEFYLRRYKQ